MLLISCCTVFSQKNYPKGEIVDSLFVNANPKESFSLYLPSQYESSKKSPIVFIFDPAARGKVGITPFIKASEEYGYILVCSNDTKNGPYEQNFNVINNLFEAVFTDFIIDEKRIYTAGFSGGSRLASKVALLTNQVQGVVACGAGFSSKLDLIGQGVSFSYASIVGDLDMNYLEMIETKEYLNGLNISNELFIYDIKHKWPSQDQVLRAFEWLQLEAYKKKLARIDNKQINDIYSNYNNKALEHHNEKNLLYVHQEYKRIIKNFKRYYKVDSIQNKLKILENDKIYKNENKVLSSAFNEEKILTTKFTDRFNKDYAAKKKNLKWWKNEISKLNKRTEITTGQELKMLNRLLYKIYALAIETVAVEGVQNIDQAIFCYDICILIYPNYPPPYFKQIENYIQKNDISKSLDYLEELLNTGFDNIELIKKNPAFETLKVNKRFVGLITN